MASYLVSGAGTASVNGTYEQNGTSDGVPAYKLQGVEMYLFRIDIGVKGWEIWSSLGHSANNFYFIINSGDTPPPNGWSVNTGNAPAPTISLVTPTTTTAAERRSSWDFEEEKKPPKPVYVPPKDNKDALKKLKNDDYGVWEAAGNRMEAWH